MPNCFIYCRVSTEEQADKGLSLDTQERLCREFAERSGFNVSAVYRDEGKSATNLDRAALQELLSKCTKDSGIGAVIVQETDRLARNTKDHLTIKAILKKAGLKLISVAQPMLDDSPEGMMIDTILASVNQFQSDINSRKTRRGLQEKLSMGWWPGWAPLGYLNVSISSADDTRSFNTISKDPNKWELVREGLQLYLSGNYSVLEIRDILHEKGLRSKHGKKMAHSVMVKTLRNPFYAGMMTWGDHSSMGKHDAMITIQEHKRVLEIMDTHNLHACRRRKHSFLLRGFLLCNRCGHRYTAEVHLRKKAYYRCPSMGMHSNRNQNVEVSRLEGNVADQFCTIQFTEEFTQRIVAKLRETYVAQRESVNTRKLVLLNQRKAIEAKRYKAEEKLLDGVISDEDFLRLRTMMTEQLASIQERVGELDYQREVDVDTVQQVLRLSRNVHQAYLEAPYELKRQYLGLFWDKLYVQDRHIVKAVPTELILSLQREKRIRIRNDWQPSPALIRTIEDAGYMAELQGKLGEILGCVNVDTDLTRAT